MSSPQPSTYAQQTALGALTSLLKEHGVQVIYAAMMSSNWTIMQTRYLGRSRVDGRYRSHFFKAFKYIPTGEYAGMEFIDLDGDGFLEGSFKLYAVEPVETTATVYKRIRPNNGVKNE